MTTQTRKYFLLIGGALLLLLIAGFIWASVRFKPMLRQRLVTAIREQYKREVEIKDPRISLLPFSAAGEGFVLNQKDRPGLPPLATIKKLTVEAGLRGILSEPLRIERVTLEGLQLNIPPKRKDPDNDEEPKCEPPRFVIGEVIADGTLLQILPKKEGKEPLTFDISKLTLNSAGTTEPMEFHATLTNAKPPGDIQSTGTFGPWQNDEPSLTPVSGRYTFQNADLSVFKGIAGKLASEGGYKGMLGRIEVDGWTDTPDFTVRVSSQPVHLKTQFHAIVGATVQLGGGYVLEGGELDFTGTLRTEAKVSQMTTGIKSFFLKLVDPLFKKKGAGAVIPIKISGTQAEPKFGLDKGRVFSGK